MAKMQYDAGRMSTFLDCYTQALAVEWKKHHDGQEKRRKGGKYYNPLPAYNYHKEAIPGAAKTVVNRILANGVAVVDLAAPEVQAVFKRMGLEPTHDVLDAYLRGR